MYMHFACDHNPYKHTNIRYILNTSFPPRLQQNAHITEGLDAIRKIVPIMYNGEPVPFLRSTTQFLTFRPINLAAPFMPGLVIMSSCGKLNSKRATIKATTPALHQQLQDTTLVSIENSLESRILRLQSEDEKGVPNTDLVDVCTYDVVTDGVMTTKNFLKNDMCVSLAKPVIMFWLSLTSEEELDEATTDKTCNAAKTFFAVNNFPMSTSPGDTIDQEIFGNPLHTASLLEPNLLQGLAKSLLNSAPFHSSLTTYVKFAEHIPDINDEGAWNNEDEAAKSHIIEHVLNTLRIGTNYLIAHVINSGQTLMAIQTVHPESANYVEFLCKFTTMARSLAHDGSVFDEFPEYILNGINATTAFAAAVTSGDLDDNTLAGPHPYLQVLLATLKGCGLAETTVRSGTPGKRVKARQKRSRLLKWQHTRPSSTKPLSTTTSRRSSAMEASKCTPG
jgi:hypothetical protein